MIELSLSFCFNIIYMIFLHNIYLVHFDTSFLINNSTLSDAMCFVMKNVAQFIHYALLSNWRGFGKF